MDEIALHTRIKPGCETGYDAAHASLAPRLNAAMAKAGVRNWRIWRSGRELFHLIEVDDYARMRRQLAQDPHNLAWQEEINQYLEVQDDYSGDDRGLGQVWDFATDYERSIDA